MTFNKKWQNKQANIAIKSLDFNGKMIFIHFCYVQLAWSIDMKCYLWNDNNCEKKTCQLQQRLQNNIFSFCLSPPAPHLLPSLSHPSALYDCLYLFSFLSLSIIFSLLPLSLSHAPLPSYLFIAKIETLALVTTQSKQRTS